MRVKPFITYCYGISKSLKMEEMLTPLFPFSPTQGQTSCESRGSALTRGFSQCGGSPEQKVPDEIWKGGEGNARSGVIFNSGEKCPAPRLQKLIAEKPEKDLCTRPQIKRPRNEGTWAGI